MATLAEIYQYFKEDDYKAIEEEMEHRDLVTMVMMAVTYCAEGRQLKPYTTRVILQNMLLLVGVHHVIWSADQIINEDVTATMELDPQIMAAMIGVNIALVEPDEEDLRAINKKLVEIIGTCSEPEFKQVLAFVARTDLVVDLPGGAMLTMLERIKRVLRDDRVFFLILHSAILANVIEDILAEIDTSGEVRQHMIEQLEAAGYMVENIPEVPGGYKVSAPDEADLPEISSYPTGVPGGGYRQNRPESGTDWVSKYPRRKHSRRYGR